MTPDTRLSVAESGNAVGTKAAGRAAAAQAIPPGTKRGCPQRGSTRQVRMRAIRTSFQRARQYGNGNGFVFIPEHDPAANGGRRCTALSLFVLHKPCQVEIMPPKLKLCRKNHVLKHTATRRGRHKTPASQGSEKIINFQCREVVVRGRRPYSRAIHGMVPNGMVPNGMVPNGMALICVAAPFAGILKRHAPTPTCFFPRFRSFGRRAAP